MPPALTWLVRHGQSASNAGLPAVGHGEVPLTALGREQAREVARRVDRQPDLLIVSPFLRAQETAAPMQNDRELRPGLGVAREKVLQLDERVGLHEKLEPLMDIWKARDLAIVQGVGYPDPNRSHFRSIEIWDTASSSSQTLSEGWVARAFEHAALPKGTGVDSIVIDTNSLPLMGPDLRTIVMQDAENFLRQAQAMKDDAAGR